MSEAVISLSDVKSQVSAEEWQVRQDLASRIPLG